jgi:hypothetical protein
VSPLATQIQIITDYYEHILTIPNTADLEWPATDPANAGECDEFLLGIFPPDHGGNHTPPTTPSATPKL